MKLSFYLCPLLLMALILSGCERKRVPELVTVEVTEISAFSAKSGGQIISDGGAAITSSGICWTTKGDPTISDNKTDETSEGNSFASYMTDLESGTPYCVRAYAENSEGVGYGNPEYFSTYPTIPYISEVTISSVTATTAVVGGNFIFGNGLVIFTTGVCYGTKPNVGFTNTHIPTTIASDTIQVNLKNLQSNTLYYIQLCVIVRLSGTVNYYAILGPESTFITLAEKQ
ncbi:MAG: hypothetical protein V1903_06065 [Bacteroidota bacterium]